MSFCSNCGKEILEGAKFCAVCGTPVLEKTVPPVTDTAPSFSDAITEEALIKEEQEFLDDTYKLLRWERKAWSICGKVYTIIGIVLMSIFGFFAFIGFTMAIGEGDPDAAAVMMVGIVYMLFCGAPLFTIGTIQRKVANKMPIYLNSLYTDFSVTNNRSGNVGMLVLSILFGEVAVIFFIINFVRLKAGGNVIKRILARQGKI